MHQIRTAHLFAGAGGGILADMLLRHRPICAVEINPFCQKVLQARQEDGCLPWFPIFDDVKEFDGKPWRGLVDIVNAGFPCQPYSTVGKRTGADDDKNLWPDTIRIIREMAPRFALLENVPGLLHFDYFGQILGDLAGARYNAEWDVISASEMGAPHQRERLWIFAYKNNRHTNCPEQNKIRTMANRSINSSRDNSGYIKPWGCDDAQNTLGEDCLSILYPNTTNKAKPGIQLLVDGMANHMDQLAAIGNGQVSIVAAAAFLILAERAGVLSKEKMDQITRGIHVP